MSRSSDAVAVGMLLDLLEYLDYEVRHRRLRVVARERRITPMPPDSSAPFRRLLDDIDGTRLTSHDSRNHYRPIPDA